MPSYAYPQWFRDLIGGELPPEDGRLNLHGVDMVMRQGLLRDETCIDAGQTQTRSTFAYKWQRADSYGSDAMVAMSREWLERRYGALWRHTAARPGGSERPLLLDAGCGSCYSAQILLEDRFPKLRYVGMDISRAVDVAAASFTARGHEGALVQADLMRIPFADGAFDIVFSEGSYIIRRPRAGRWRQWSARLAWEGPSPFTYTGGNPRCGSSPMTTSVGSLQACRRSRHGGCWSR